MYFRSLSTLGFFKSEPKAYYNFVVLILKNRLRYLPFHLILTENSALSNKKNMQQENAGRLWGNFNYNEIIFSLI